MTFMYIQVALAVVGEATAVAVVAAAGSAWAAAVAVAVADLAGEAVQGVVVAPDLAPQAAFVVPAVVPVGGLA